jgi:thiamine biosynthesis lipoprotein
LFYHWQMKIQSLLFLLICPLLLFAQAEPILLSGYVQGTTYHISYFDAQNRDLQEEIEKLLQEFDLSVSTYNTQSIISKINRNEKKVVTDQYFNTCFIKAKEVWKNTDGAFDPTVFPLVNAWGFGPGRKQKIEQKVIDSILPFVGFSLIELKGNKVKKNDKRVALDFNAFAQGYSVDVVSDFFNKKGIYAYLVEIGGEVYAHGKKPDGSKWTVGIEQPYDNPNGTNQLRAIVQLENKALATSGNYRKFIIENGVKYAHHIDPKTGYPAKNNLLSVSLFSNDCISSDANATGILVMGLEKAKLFLAKHQEFEAYLIYSDEQGQYQVYMTPGLKDMIQEMEGE